jgi:hypothetical protein
LIRLQKLRLMLRQGCFRMSHKLVGQPPTWSGELHSVPEAVGYTSVIRLLSIRDTVKASKIDSTPSSTVQRPDSSDARARTARHSDRNRNRAAGETSHYRSET